MTDTETCERCGIEAEPGYFKDGYCPECYAFVFESDIP